MKKVINLVLFTCLLQFAHAAYANEISFLEEKIKAEQKNWPTGKLDDIGYVKKVIHKMYLTDQEVRQAFLKDMNHPKVQNLITSMDDFHTAKMKEILQQNGWLTISRYGHDTDHQAWLLVQHADQDPFFQAGCLFVLTNLVAKGETDKKNYAYLYDRVALKFENLGMKQKYGTQVNIGSADIKLLPYEGSIADLNQRRYEAGLNTIEEYLETIKKVYQR